MPRRLARPCAYPGCPELVSKGRHCERHKTAASKQDAARRGTARERGYTTQWEKVRRMKLRQDPLCERCLTEGRTTPAVLVHHIKPIAEGGEPLAMDNLMSLCRACHDAVHRGKGDQIPGA